MANALVAKGWADKSGPDRDLPTNPAAIPAAAGGLFVEE